jgi:hypothetical protein
MCERFFPNSRNSANRQYFRHFRVLEVWYSRISWHWQREKLEITRLCVCLNLFGFPNFKQLLSHVLPVLQQGTQQKRVSSLSLTWVSSCFFIYSLKHTFSVIYPINKNERHQYWTKLSQLFPKTMERTCLSILVEQVPSEIVAKKCRTCF